jgi:putative SOS response-associated peptidase YedK
MCGRYVSTRSPKDLTRLFNVEDWRPEEALDQLECRAH